MTDSSIPDAWRAALTRFAEGDPAARIDVPASSTEIEQLRTIVNEGLERAAVRYGVLHDSVMEIAVGLSDVYETLYEFRNGDASRRVTPETLASPEGLVGHLGAMINDLLDEVSKKTP